MTPAARVQAAAEILDRILSGAPAEQALVNWARSSRFAGSGDRAAVRDHVFDALRQRRSFAALGGGETGRGLMLGLVRALGLDEGALFSGQAHALAPVQPGEEGRPPTKAEGLDLPDWLIPRFEQSLGDQATAIAQAMKTRAPVFLRANLSRAPLEKGIAALAAEGIVARPHPLAPTALEVTEGQRKIQTSQAYAGGMVELQDASSQAVVQALPLSKGMKVLDYCAGGGGKTLAMADRMPLSLFAHDADPRRMADLPARAKRAGAKVTLTQTPQKTAPYDLVLIDVPCSGSGSWRRDPSGKWRITPEHLQDLARVQSDILDQTARLVRPNGVLAYATCSLLAEENHDRIADFLTRTPGWRLDMQRQFTPLEEGDGFYIALMTRD